MPLSVIVLAAGQGKRMHSDLPKVLHPLAGKPLLGHVLETARELGPAGIRIVYGHGGEAVKNRFGGTDLHWCLQAEQLGTGHAVEQALPEIPDAHEALVLCGDVPLIRPATLRRLLSAAANTDLAVLTARVPDPTGYGRIIRDPAGSVERIVEQNDGNSDELAIDEINTGIIAANAGRLRGWLRRVENDNAQGEYYLTDVIGVAVREGAQVAAEIIEDPEEAMGINDKSQLARAERRVQQAAAGRLLDAGATLADPARIDVRGHLQVGRDVYIDVGVVFEGEVVLGDGVSIGPYCVIGDSRIGERTRIHSHSVVSHGVLGTNCRIGPFARIRPQTELADGVRIGNFVETKKSRIAAGSKVNHLSYVGDTSIGRKVNVGAGTITCNYDGANKHRTVIGDDAFIGSGVNLVAPVQVGAGATIGAGSTVTKDVPPGKLSIARSRQTTVEGWRRPAKKAD